MFLNYFKYGDSITFHSSFSINKIHRVCSKYSTDLVSLDKDPFDGTDTTFYEKLVLNAQMHNIFHKMRLVVADTKFEFYSKITLLDDYNHGIQEDISDLRQDNFLYDLLDRLHPGSIKKLLAQFSRTLIYVTPNFL